MERATPRCRRGHSPGAAAPEGMGATDVAPGAHRRTRPTIRVMIATFTSPLTIRTAHFRLMPARCPEPPGCTQSEDGIPLWPVSSVSKMTRPRSRFHGLLRLYASGHTGFFDSEDCPHRDTNS